MNLSSVSAKLTSTRETAVYAATKTTILALTRTFAYALAERNVRVYAICPGITDTPMQETVLQELARLRGVSYDEIASARNDTVPMKRTCAPEDVAGMIWRMLSDDASTYDRRGPEPLGRPGDAATATARRLANYRGMAGGRSATVSQPDGAATIRLTELATRAAQTGWVFMPGEVTNLSGGAASIAILSRGSNPTTPGAMWPVNSASNHTWPATRAS